MHTHTHTHTHTHAYALTYACAVYDQREVTAPHASEQVMPAGQLQSSRNKGLHAKSGKARTVERLPVLSPEEDPARSRHDALHWHDFPA